MRSGRRGAGAIVLALALAVAGLFGSALGGTAHAATAYRYWAYYVASGGSWHYSQRGPAAEHPADGEVQGWRFAVQVDKAGSLPPRVQPDFDQLCASTAAVAGQLRVGIVLDFGLASDAPGGEAPPAKVVTGCVHVPTGASGVDVLDAAVGAAHVRIGAGLICGIDGYPKTECTPAVAATSTKAPAAPTKTPVAATKTPVTPTKVPAAPTKTPAAPTKAAGAAESPNPLVASPSPLTSSPVSASDTPSSAPATSSAPAATLESLRTPAKRHSFPVAAIVGGVLVVGLGAAAIWRGLAGRR